MILVGTCGYSYPDWKGEFYPAGTGDRDMLKFYARQFPVVELDFTYYRLPNARTMGAIAGKTPAGFDFCVKAFRDMTHSPSAPRDELAAALRAFREGIEPVVSAGKLGCILAQFPFSFKQGEAARAHLSFLREMLPDLPLVVEFRNREWVAPETFDFLRENQCGFCCVDEPALPSLMPRLATATADLGYVRFHGRNAARWWKHGEAWERYNYLYSQEELGEWVPKLREVEQKTKKTYVLFNNCHAAQAARNARMMRELLGAGG